MTQTSRCRQTCQQTAWSHLQPPALRLKARWLNVQPVVSWALKVIGYGQRHRLHHGPFAQIFGWLNAYEHEGLNRRQVRRSDRKLGRLSQA